MNSQSSNIGNIRHTLHRTKENKAKQNSDN